VSALRTTEPGETTVLTRHDRSTVLLSDAEEAASLAALLSASSGPAACYRSVAELVHRQPLSSIAVLVLLFHPLPKGSLLATLGRMNLEYPAMQKVAVLDGPPPLPIAEYLTACRVDMLMNGSTQTRTELAAVVNRLHERIPWIAS
jgi:hypothetical protein